MSVPALKRFAFSLLPTPVRIQGSSFLKNYLLDLRDEITGKVDHEVPPRHLNISGDGPFRTYGQNTVNLCRKYAGLKPEDDVLDIGCGIGRTALALEDFLSSGCYAGFDIIRFAVEWCREHIGAQRSNFKFMHADIYNRTYNPQGKQRAEAFQFPFEPGSFSFALATSLFTHVLPEAAENYVAQTGLVLKPGGKFLSTWFLLDEETEAALENRKTRVSFPHRYHVHAQGNLHAPEQAVAFSREYVLQTFEKRGFRIEAVLRGDWSNTGDAIESMQDMIVAHRI